MMEKAIKKVQSVLLAAAGSVSLFVFTAFLVTGILCMEPMVWYREQIDLINQYVVFPWGMALCLLRLERRKAAAWPAPRRDVQVLFVLLLWIIAPFMLRFGVTFNNMGAWYNHAVVYFGIYAFLSEKSAEERERSFDLMVLLCGVLTFTLAGALLYCAATAQTIYHGAQTMGFGLNGGAHITYGLHYNLSAMLMVCLAMITLAGVTRSRALPLRLFFAAGAAMMLIAVVLTQSRTARYASIVALSVGTYGVIAGRVKMRRRALHQLTALAAAAVVLVGAYVGAAKLTDAALMHYAKIQNARAQGQAVGVIDQTVDAVIAPALAEETAGQETAVQPMEARAAVDSTFSDRTTIWKNLFELWAENPKNMIIGNGVGRTGRYVVKGTIHEEAGAVQLHNTYLQHTADFGLIGTGLLALFFILLVRPLLGVFLARGDKRKPGYTALCMLVIAMLATGMMESAPLGGFSPANMMLFFALALLAGRGHDLAHL